MCKAADKANPEYCGPLPPDQVEQVMNPTPASINATYIGTSIVENVEMHEFEFMELMEVPETHGNYSMDDPDPSMVTIHKVRLCSDACSYAEYIPAPLSLSLLQSIPADH